MSLFVPIINVDDHFADIEGAESWPIAVPSDDLSSSEWVEDWVLFRSVYRTRDGGWLLCESSFLYAEPPARCWFGEITPARAARLLLEEGHALPDDLALMVRKKAKGESGEPPGPSPLPPLVESETPVRSSKLNPGSKAIAAAIDLKNEGKPVTLKAACDRAGVDRKNIRSRYPDVVKAIRALGTADRTPRRGTRDRRTGTVDGVDEADG